jgi:hypothetical protein
VESGTCAGSPSGQRSVPFEITDPSENDGRALVVVERLHRPETDFPHASKPIPVGRPLAALIFWQAASAPGGSPFHPGDETNHPQEAHELLGWYEIRYADGLTRAAEARFGRNLLAWDEGHGLLYHAREVEAGALPGGGPIVIWGFEWTNPRPAVPIESVTLRGAGALPELRRPEGGTSDARPMLFALTGIEWPHWGDYRPGKGDGQLPGMA